MVIALGTTSESKVAIFKSVLASLNLSSAELRSYSVESEITDQPLDEQITIQGATNRAKNAISSDIDADIGVGLEAGLEKINGIYHLVCVAAIKSKEGNVYIGVSGKVALPKAVSDEVSGGKQFGKSVREYKLNNASDKSLIFLLDRLITREHDFKEAIANAFVAFTNSSHL